MTVGHFLWERYISRGTYTGAVAFASAESAFGSLAASVLAATKASTVLYLIHGQKQSHVIVTTVCGKTFCTNPCPQYACPYATDHGLVFTRMPAGRCTNATLEAFLDYADV